MIDVSFLYGCAKALYVVILLLLASFLLSSYIPFCAPVGGLVASSLAFFYGAALCCTMWHAFSVINKKCSKYLLQYLVVGLSSGMNLQESLASGGAWRGVSFKCGVSSLGYILII